MDIQKFFNGLTMRAHQTLSRVNKSLEKFPKSDREYTWDIQGTPEEREESLKRAK